MLSYESYVCNIEAFSHSYRGLERRVRDHIERGTGTKIRLEWISKPPSLSLQLQRVTVSVDLKTIGPIAPNWALCLRGRRRSYLLSAVQVHNTLQILQWTALVPHLLRPDLVAVPNYIIQQLYQPKSVKWDQLKNTCPTPYHTRNI